MESKVMSLVGQNLTIQAQPFSREWFVSFKDPLQLWEDHWFALTLEIAFAAILFQLFRKAKKHAPQMAYIILAAICTDITLESLPIIPRPGYQLWWYHQGIVNVVKQRLPSYIVTSYALVFYLAHSLTCKSNLPMFTRSLVNAVSATLIMFPCLWFAPRFLLQCLHMDDPVFQHRLAGVPYNQIIVTLLSFFHTSHLFQQNFEEIEPQERNTLSYMKCAFQTGFASGIYAIVEQYLLYILLNLTLRAHTATCLVAALAILLYLARKEVKEMQLTSYSIHGIISPLLRREFWMVVAAMMFVSTLPLWLNTQNLKSTSDRLELGPCHITHDVSNTSPLEVQRRRYVCPDDGKTLSFDFHCLPTKELMQGVKNNTKHYTICGKALEHPNLVANTWLLYSACCLTVFYVVMLFSFTFKVKPKKIVKTGKKVE